jgi:D-glycero-D-manno-heptose 1,7-bisphosphate phosphatase
MKSEMSKILFLDRDGVVNIDKHFVSRVEDIVFVKGIFQLCKYFEELDYRIVIATNQSGIARGLFSEQEFHAVMSFIVEEFKRHAIDVLACVHCPHGPDDNCKCRKPLPGLFTQALRQFNIEAENCISIGDRERDIEAALAAGISQNYLLQDSQMNTGHFLGSIVVNSLSEIVQIHQRLSLDAQN